MKKVMVTELEAGSILAQDVFSQANVQLIPAGTVLKEEVIQHLIEMHVSQVSVCEYGETVKNDPGDVYQDNVPVETKKMLRSTFERFTFNDNEELRACAEVAEKVLLDVLNQPEVMYNVNVIKRNGFNLYCHAMNVATLSVLIAIHAGISKENAREVAIGALLHDIGFVSMKINPDSVDLEDCDENMRKEVMRHVTIGYKALENEAWLSKTAKDIILQHHERLDGSGYPFQVSGENLSMEVRIVSLCDQFDNMVYGNMMKQYKVRDTMDYIMSSAGGGFDLNLVQCFFESVAAYPNGSIVITNEGDIAVVVRQNYRFPTRPVIRLIRSKSGKDYVNQAEQDLTKCLTIFIMDSIERQ